MIKKTLEVSGQAKLIQEVLAAKEDLQSPSM
jgi:hypothetical protein